LSSLSVFSVFFFIGLSSYLSSSKVFDFAGPLAFEMARSLTGLSESSWNFFFKTVEFFLSSFLRALVLALKN